MSDTPNRTTIAKWTLMAAHVSIISAKPNSPTQTVMELQVGGRRDILISYWAGASEPRVRLALRDAVLAGNDPRQGDFRAPALGW